MGFAQQTPTKKREKCRQGGSRDASVKLHFTLSGRVLNICVKSEPKNQAKASKKVECGRRPPHVRKPSLLRPKNTRARGSTSLMPLVFGQTVRSVNWISVLVMLGVEPFACIIGTSQTW